MAHTVIGIDIAFEAVKICGLSKTGRDRYRLVGLNYATIPKDSWASNELKNATEIAQVLRQSVSTSKPSPIRAKLAVIALPETVVYSATFSMPVMKEAELKDALPYEIAERLNLNPEEYYFDYETLTTTCQPLNETVNVLGQPAKQAALSAEIKPSTGHQLADHKTGKTKSAEVDIEKPHLAIFAVAAKRSLVDSVIECVHQADLEVLGIDVKAGAIVNALIPQRDQKMRLIVDLGAGITGVTVTEGKSIHLISSVPIGTKGLGDNDLAGFKQIGGPIFDELVHATKFFENRMCPGRKIEEILLIGGSSTITGLTDFFTAQTGLKTYVGNPFSQVDTHGYPIPDEFVHKFADAIGCAMRDK